MSKRRSNPLGAFWSPPRPPARQGKAHVWTVIGLAVLSVAAAVTGMKLRKEKRAKLITLSVRSEPAPAEVRLDGRFVGLTPLEVSEVAAGTHLVAISRDGYETHTERRVLVAGAEKVEARLKRKAVGSLAVRTVPEGAEVILDGQSRGNTPLDMAGLAPGSYRLVLRKAGHEFWTREVGVKGGERAEISAVLENSVLKFLRAAVQNNPKDLHYWTELGHYLGCHDRDKESLEAFRRGMELCMEPGVKQDEVRRHFQMLNRQMNWPGKKREGFRRQIGVMFVEIARKHSGDAKAVGRLALVLEQARRYSEALDLYLRACRQTKGADLNLVVRGFSLATRLKHMTAARELVDLVRSGRPKDYRARLRLGDLCVQAQGRYKTTDRGKLLAMAEQLYSEAAGLTKNSTYRARAYYGRARAQSFAQNTAEAAKSYGLAAEAIMAGGKGNRRKWAEWEFERANLLIKLGRKQDARGVLTRIVKDAPKGATRDRAEAELKRLGPAK